MEEENHEFEDKDDFKEYLKNMTHDVIIFKFHADWCGPCKAISPHVKTELTRINEDSRFKKSWKLVHIDVDESFDLYAFMKRMKMVKGVPTILCYTKSGFDEDRFYVPAYSVVGAKAQPITQMFETVLL